MLVESRDTIAAVFEFALRGAGGLVAYWGVRETLRGQASSSWPRVEGLVTESRIADQRESGFRLDRSKVSGTARMYRAVVRHTYDVAGTSRFQRGYKPWVVYNPSSPADACLEPGAIGWLNVVPVVFGTVWFFLPLPGMITAAIFKR